MVGAGLSGSVIARILAERGNRVIVWDRRNHIGGNIYDYTDEHGILVQQYGPHTFHTKNRTLYQFMQRFADWTPYFLKCGAVIQGQFTPTPFNFKTIDQFYPEEEAEELKQHLAHYFGRKDTVTIFDVLGANDALIREYGEFLFKHDYSIYTAKQWGISPKDVDPSILKRLPLRFSYEEGYFDDEYQVVPTISYHQFFKTLLNHPNIEIRLNMDALKHLIVDTMDNCVLIDGQKIETLTVIYTGALDELFALDNGSLPYKSLEFEWYYQDTDSFQPYPVVAYPLEKYTRITEYKKLPVQNVKGTTYAVEYSLPYDPAKKQEPYYPVLTEWSLKRAKVYKDRADRLNNFYYCGRLADFKYYNMDQALKRALQVANQIQEQLQ